MKKLSVLLLILPSLAIAKEDGWFSASKDVDCGPFRDIVTILTDKNVQEVPVWIGNDDNQSRIAVFINEKTSTWTVVQYDKETGCVLGMGRSSKMYKLEEKK